MCIYIILYLFCRVTKQAINAEVGALGGVSLKTPIPHEEDALKAFSSQK